MLVHVLRVVGVVPTLSGLVTTPTTLSGKPSQSAASGTRSANLRLNA